MIADGRASPSNMKLTAQLYGRLLFFGSRLDARQPICESGARP
jgi:hypothetical protein